MQLKNAPAGRSIAFRLKHILTGIRRVLGLDPKTEQHKQVETQLRLLSQAVEQSPVSIIITGLDGGIQYVNPKFTQVTGYTPEEVLGKNPRILKSGEMPPERYQNLWATITTGGVWRGEFHNKKKNGDLYWEAASISPVMDDNGQITHFLAVKEDITAYHELQDRLRRHNQSLEALHQSTLEFLRQRDLSALLRALVDHAARLLDAPYVEIFKVEENLLAPLMSSPNVPAAASLKVSRDEARLSWQAVDTHEPVVVEDYMTLSNRNPVYDNIPLHAVADFPIITGDRCLGVLAIGRDRPGYPFESEQVQVGKLFAQIAALAIENAQMSAELYELSIRDPLTGLHNRRYLFEILPRELARAVRENYAISFVLLDIDQFKTINDSFGHNAGDAALLALAAQLKNLVRASDILCRYGGDEHIVVLYDTPPATALARAEQWRQSIQNMTTSFQGQELKFTISLGVATFPVHGDTIDEVIGHADQALYHSKNTGRNRVTLYPFLP